MLIQKDDKIYRIFIQFSIFIFILFVTETSIFDKIIKP